jgi:hypothetical protein
MIVAWHADADVDADPRWKVTRLREGAYIIRRRRLPFWLQIARLEFMAARTRHR